MLKAIAGVVLALFMAACATTNNKSNYDAYLKANIQMKSEEAMAAQTLSVAKAAQYASLRESCTTDQCVANVAAFQAIADVVASLGGSSSRSATIAPPQREPTLSEQAMSWASVLIPGISTYVGVVETNKTQRHLSDNQAQRDVSQNQMWSDIMSSTGAAWSAAAAQPSVVVGGNYGTTNTAGTNLVSGSSNTIGENNNNSGRITSPGPYDDNSGDCRNGDENCPVTNPEPTP